jgi:hypothetical protein
VRDLPELHVFAQPLATQGPAGDLLDRTASRIGVRPSDDTEAVARRLEANSTDPELHASLQHAALEREPAILELVDGLCAPDALFGENTRKVMVLAHHRSVMDEMQRGLANLDLLPVAIRGDQDAATRQRMIDAFQDNPKVRAVVVQLQVGSTAVNLTAATDVIFAELDWTAANNSQCVARAWRMGQGRPVDVRLCLGTSRIEQGQARVVARRLASIDRIAPDSINAALVEALTGSTPEPATDDWLA